jgi:hypothetical protein
MFDRVCLQHHIEHRFTKPNHPWTNGQVERNRTLKEATVRRYQYSTHQQLAAHLSSFLDAYNFARRLKTLAGLTPYEAICKAWVAEPQRFLGRPKPPNLGTEHLGPVAEEDRMVVVFTPFSGTGGARVHGARARLTAVGRTRP